MSRLNMNALIQKFTRQVPLTPTFTAVAGSTGFQFQNTGRELIAVMNGASASTYSIGIGTVIEGQAVAPVTGNLPTSNTVPTVFGPFPRDFNQPDGSLFFDVGTATTVTVAILQFQGVN